MEQEMHHMQQYRKQILDNLMEFQQKLDGALNMLLDTRQTLYLKYERAQANIKEAVNKVASSLNSELNQRVEEKADLICEKGLLVENIVTELDTLRRGRVSSGGGDLAAMARSISALEQKLSLCFKSVDEVTAPEVVFCQNRDLLWSWLYLKTCTVSPRDVTFYVFPVAKATANLNTGDMMCVEVTTTGNVSNFDPGLGACLWCGICPPQKDTFAPVPGRDLGRNVFRFLVGLPVSGQYRLKVTLYGVHVKGSPASFRVEDKEEDAFAQARGTAGGLPLRTSKSVGDLRAMASAATVKDSPPYQDVGRPESSPETANIQGRVGDDNEKNWATWKSTPEENRSTLDSDGGRSSPNTCLESPARCPSPGRDAVDSLLTAFIKNCRRRSDSSADGHRGSPLKKEVRREEQRTGIVLGGDPGEEAGDRRDPAVHRRRSSEDSGLCLDESEAGRSTPELDPEPRARRPGDCGTVPARPVGGPGRSLGRSKSYGALQSLAAAEGGNDWDLVFVEGTKRQMSAKSTRFWQDTKVWSMRSFRLRGKFLWSFGEWQDLDEPSGVCSTGNNSVVLCDSSRHKVLVLDSSGRLSFEFGKRGMLDGQFVCPSAVVSFRNGDLAVKDERRIQVFSPEGDFRWSTREILTNPCGLSLDVSGRLVTLDAGQRLSTLCIFSRDGQFLSRELFLPLGCPFRCRSLAASQNRIAVVDTEQHCVFLTSYDRALRVRFGSEGVGRGQFRNPAGISFDLDGNMLVADTGNNRIQVFNRQGSFQGMVGLPRPVPGPTDIFLTNSGKLLVISSKDRMLFAYDLE